MFYFHILYLNMNEWVPVKGCIYRGYGQMNPMGNITSVETLDEL